MSNRKEYEIVEALKTAHEVSKTSVANNKDRLGYISGYISERLPHLADVLFEIYSDTRWDKL